MDKSLYKKAGPAKKVDLNDFESEEEIVDDVQKILEEAPKRRGRPRKNLVDEHEEIINEVKPKRRGRPRKNPIIEEKEEIEENNIANVQVDDEENGILPGLNEELNYNDNSEFFSENDMEIEKNEDMNVLPGFEDFSDEDEKTEIISGFEDNDDDIDDDLDNDIYNMNNNSNRFDNDNNENKYMKEYDNIFDDEEFEGLLSSDKKVVSFVGTSKNGTSFLINNVALILSNMGINTAILDATTNKNAFYIYNKGEEDLRKIALNCFDNLKNEVADGIKVNNNLTVYTTIPSKKDGINDSRPILETLIKNHSLILIDTDFSTPIEYFDKSQEIYLVQSMDVLTIQPLTEFLRELKVKNVLDERKIRIVLNKLLNVKGVNAKRIIGGMSNYNDPEMSFMTELFNRNTVKLSAQIPFDEDVYIKYLSSLVECEIQINSYPKDFRQRLSSLAEQIYPLLPAKNSDSKKGKKNSKNHNGTFSEGMNSTLDSMRKKY